MSRPPRTATPPDVTTSYHDGPLGRMRSRSVGRPVAQIAEIALVQGLGVADYLLPALRALGDWTRAHLIELPGLAGSADPPHPLDLAGYADAVRDWLSARPGTASLVLGGHSSGTQIAARAAVGHDRVAGVVLASPTTDPAVRGLPGLAWRWRRDGRVEPSGLTGSHLPEWRRAGPQRLLRLVRGCLADRIESSIRSLDVPLLVVHGADDRISDARWLRSLAELVTDGRAVRVPGAHTFVWAYPEAWSRPIRDFVTGLSVADRS